MKCNKTKTCTSFCQVCEKLLTVADWFKTPNVVHKKNQSIVEKAAATKPHRANRRFCILVTSL